MSKKDYQAIAAGLYRERQQELYRRESGRGEKESSFSAGFLSGLSAAVDLMASVLASDNPRFSRERFIEACETGKTLGMRSVA